MGKEITQGRAGSSGTLDNVANGKIGNSSVLYDFWEDWLKATGNNYSLVADDAISGGDSFNYVDSSGET